jgi:hypothetical protein
MMGNSKDREILKNRVVDWMAISNSKKGDSYDMLILETFFYIYNGLSQGYNIQELGNELGVFPVP